MYTHNWRYESGEFYCTGCSVLRTPDNLHDACEVIETAMTRVVPVKVRRTTARGVPFHKIKVIKAIRNTTPPSLGNDLRTAKEMGDRVAENEMVTVYSTNPHDFKKELEGHGVLAMMEPPRLSPKAAKVVNALDNKPELLQEILTFLAWRGDWHR